MPVNARSVLGPLVATTCLQQLRIHTEELVGRGPVLGAGRLRGQGIIVGLGLQGSRLDDDTLFRLLADTFGVEGTRLCLLTRLASDQAGGYVVQLQEGACTHLQETTEPMCAYTLGVFVGALQAVNGVVLQGTETECQAMGDPSCTYLIRPHPALG